MYSTVILRKILNKESIEIEWSKCRPNSLDLIHVKNFLKLARRILKKDLISVIKTLGIWEQVGREQYVQEDPAPRIEIQNSEKQITAEIGTTTSMLTQENRLNVELIKKITTKKEDYITIPRDPRLEKI